MKRIYVVLLTFAITAFIFGTAGYVFALNKSVPEIEAALISQFSDAVIDKRLQYNQACILVNNATETNWLQNMMKICNAVCFFKSRVKFIDMNGNPTGAPLQGQVILYIGENINGFINEFNNVGICMIKAEAQ